MGTRGTLVFGRVMQEPRKFGENGEHRDLLVRISGDDAINPKNVRLTVWGARPDHDDPDLVAIVDEMEVGEEIVAYVWQGADSYEANDGGTRTAVRSTVRGLAAAAVVPDWSVTADGRIQAQ